LLEADSSAGPLSWLYGARGGDELVFTGCGTRPLGSYLKALGVLRLIGEQLDPDATARWVAQNLVLETAGDEKRVVDFFLSEYRPTPMIAPWNGRGGFNIDENRTSEQLVAQIEDSTDERLSSLRSTIGVARDIYGRAVEEGWDKERWVQACRASFPDEAVRWLDATTARDSSSFGRAHQARQTLARPCRTAARRMAAIPSSPLKRTPGRRTTLVWGEGGIRRACFRTPFSRRTEPLRLGPDGPTGVMVAGVVPSTPELVPARMVNEFTYCPRLFFLKSGSPRSTRPQVTSGFVP